MSDAPPDLVLEHLRRFQSAQERIERKLDELIGRVANLEGGQTSLMSHARDEAVETWLRDKVAPAYDAMKADPSRGRSVAEVRDSLAAEYGRARKAR